MTRIQRLSDSLISQIAAGEVVERPASVLKELMENAIDAGASQLEVWVEQGGIELIEVRDNGQGIHQDDLPLAVIRHATSKIASLDDLESVLSLGFRGEALASIDSVSRLKLVSRRTGSQQAYQWERTSDYPNGIVLPVSAPVGTTVSVRHLYYNTPARRKFLKTESTEYAHCADVFRRLALSYPLVHFVLWHQGKKQADYTVSFEGDLARANESRFEQVLGVENHQCLLLQPQSIEVPSHGVYTLSGVLGIPDIASNRADQQFTFVNGRFVRDKTISHAVKSCFANLLHGGKHPVWLLNLSLPPRDVDVNVHPAKTEVRFKNSQLIHQLVARAVRQALETPLSIAGGSTLPVAPIFSQIKNTPASMDEKRWIPESDRPRSVGGQRVQEPWMDAEKARPSGTSSLQQAWSNAWGKDNLSIEQVAATHKTQVVPADVSLKEVIQLPADEYPLGFALGVLHGVYLLAQNKNGLVMIDIHAAHERVLYEQLKQRVELGDLPSQHLLIPHVWQATPHELAICESAPDILKKLGFELSLLDGAKVQIEAIPHALSASNPTTLLKDVLVEIEDFGVQTVLQEKMDHLLQTMSCHAAFRAKDRADEGLNMAELNSLLRQMETTINSGRCNHGRPTVFEIPMRDLDTWFARGR